MIPIPIIVLICNDQDIYIKRLAIIQTQYIHVINGIRIFKMDTVPQ